MTQSKRSTAEKYVTKLGNLVKQARNKDNWTQSTLAQKSHVSTKTIVDIEKGYGRKPRADVVIRLAETLREDPDTWLKIAGYKDIASTSVAQVVQKYGGFRFPGEIDPGVFFTNLDKRLSENECALICVAYPCSPGALHRDDIFKQILELFQKGLWVAMTCPYPRIERSGRKDRLSLELFYEEVLGQVKELVRELHGKLGDKKHRLGMFVPKQYPGEHVQYIMPFAGLSEHRPTLIKYFSANSKCDPEFEMSAWVNIMQEERDRWISIYPEASGVLNQLRHRTLLRWRDYFEPIWKACDPFKGTAWNPEDFKSTDWELIENP